jgi:hypothetical protein
MPLGEKFDQRPVDPVDFGTHVVFGLTFGWQFCGGHGESPVQSSDAGVHRQPTIFNHPFWWGLRRPCPPPSIADMFNLSELC